MCVHVDVRVYTSYVHVSVCVYIVAKLLTFKALSLQIPSGNSVRQLELEKKDNFNNTAKSLTEHSILPSVSAFQHSLGVLLSGCL